MDEFQLRGEAELYGVAEPPTQKPRAAVQAGGYFRRALAAQRLIYARDAEPNNVPVLRMMTLAFWQADNLDAAARAVRDWARAQGSR